MSNTQLIQEKESGKIVGFLGRNGQKFPLIDNTHNIMLDAPGEPYPYSVISLINGKVEMSTHTDESFIRALKQNGKTVDRAHVDEEGNLEFLN
jgi:hypothetical protein